MKSFIKSTFLLCFLSSLVSGCGNSGLSEGLLISSDISGDNWEVLIYTNESEVAQRVTDAPPFLVDKLASVEGFDLEGSWSPDGEQIVLASDRTGYNDLFIVDTKGTVIQKLTDGESKGGANHEPTWSPDGTQIAFRSDRLPLESTVVKGHGDVELWIMNSDGSNIRQFTNSPGEDWTPSWSPDGQKIVFASRRVNGSWDLFIKPVNSESEPPTQLTDGLSDNWLPAWSPDGEKIAFSSNRADEKFNIWTINADGTSLRQITNTPHESTEPVWSPDGKRLAFGEGNRKGWSLAFVNLDDLKITFTKQSGYPSDWFEEK
jgi:Tol biopolymer transport system component